MKKLLIISTLIFSPLAFALTPPAMDSFSQPDIFRNWLQNRCTGKIITSEKLKDDAFKSASAWLEVSHLPVNAFQDGDALIDNYLKLTLSGEEGGDFNVLKCTLVSESNEAKTIFKKYYK